jgi:5-methylcytosine-specific restriction endonuclease McrA
MAIRKRILDYNPLCVMCHKQGLTTAASEVDHIQPLHKGGTDDMDNLQPLCSDCHKIKTYHDISGKVGCNEQGIPEGWA